MRTPAELRALADPAQRAAAAREELDVAIARQADLAAIVRESVEEMRQTMSINAVAAALGVSRQRVQQMLRPPRVSDPVVAE